MKSVRQRMGALMGGAICMLPVAASALSFDFEDGTLQGWLPTQTGGSGSTGVEAHLNSGMAVVKHPGPYLTSLSKDFAYVPSATLAFDMQATSIAAGAGAYAGVTISFLDALNVSQGSLSLLNTDFPAGLGVTQQLVDTSPHHYSASMASFAAAAGIASTTAIKSIQVKFVASGRGFGSSDGSVWFDNVTVGPPPPTCSMQLGKSSFVDGDQINAQVAQLANPGSTSVPVEAKLWVEPAGAAVPIPIITVGADGSFVLPSGFSRDYGPLNLIRVDPSLPRGSYQLRCRVLHAVTGAQLHEAAVAYQLR